MKNIAFVFEEGKMGGPQVYALRLLSSMRFYYNATIIIPQENSDNFQVQCKLLSIPFRVLRISRLTKQLAPLLRYITCFPIELFLLWSEIKKSKYDIVYVAGGAWQFKGAIAGKLAGAKVVWHLNDACLPIYLRFIFSKLSWVATCFVCASYKTKDYYQRYLPNGRDIYVVQSPIVIDEFSPSQKVLQEEFLLEIKGDKIAIGTVCNINPIKGIEYLIKAAAAASKISDNLVFFVVGPVFESQHKYYKMLLALVDSYKLNNFHFLGERTDVRPFLRSLDIYVCSSISESSPISVWEAMSMGLPVVSTEVGDVPLFVINEYNGFVTPPGAPELMARSLIRLSTNDGLRNIYAKRSRLAAVESFSTKMCLNQHVSIFNSLLQ